MDETTKPLLLLLYERHGRVQINSCRGQARPGAVGGKLNGLKLLTYGEEGYSSLVISLRHPEVACSIGGRQCPEKNVLFSKEGGPHQYPTGCLSYEHRLPKRNLQNAP